jgi:hypothetical protein
MSGLPPGLSGLPPMPRGPNASRFRQIVQAKMIDPLSTPARRRRIIAEMSKITLRKWYVVACDNVHRQRVETAAATRIQSMYRCCISRYRFRKMIFQLKYNAARAIQCRWRVRIAQARCATLRARKFNKWAVCMLCKVRCIGAVQ